MNSKDLMIIQKIISYCEQVEHSHATFGKSYESLYDVPELARRLRQLAKPGFDHKA